RIKLTVTEKRLKFKCSCPVCVWQQYINPLPFCCRYFVYSDSDYFRLLMCCRGRGVISGHLKLNIIYYFLFLYPTSFKLQAG
ncbi:MAG: hypothetical protein RR467_06360, partial [Morganella sp. (in: enterobacteria)]